eukprot:CAMPEP_0176344606 /NCGR_PEP_ID=MMETSP0126-20121128/4820_1 /TAXON_ID=141414 ORGANISM="Strombidinopsis acuminatum, Strain SPMC142" /NCGR_SAMPLE_ID=MMETSP0126 /ASSEMBLY_ACC=CAM_ASM_000229 /LENGTH=39 /DNA_ID= /DNA_START= /DNA_END= /DNA_ORIENTATION=
MTKSNTDINIEDPDLVNSETSSEQPSANDSDDNEDDDNS